MLRAVLFTDLSRDSVEGLVLLLALQSDLHIVTDRKRVVPFLWTQ